MSSKAKRRACGRRMPAISAADCRYRSSAIRQRFVLSGPGRRRPGRGRRGGGGRLGRHGGRRRPRRSLRLFLRRGLLVRRRRRPSRLQLDEHRVRHQARRVGFAVRDRACCRRGPPPAPERSAAGSPASAKLTVNSLAVTASEQGVRQVWPSEVLASAPAGSDSNCMVVAAGADFRQIELHPAWHAGAGGQGSWRRLRSRQLVS